MRAKCSVPSVKCRKSMSVRMQDQPWRNGKRVWRNETQRKGQIEQRRKEARNDKLRTAAFVDRADWNNSSVRPMPIYFSGTRTIQTGRTYEHRYSRRNHETPFACWEWPENVSTDPQEPSPVSQTLVGSDDHRWKESIVEAIDRLWGKATYREGEEFGVRS